MAFSRGAVTAKLDAKVNNFVKGFKTAGQELESFGSKGKRLQDRLKDLERTKQTVNSRMEEMRKNGKETSVSFQNLQNRLAKYNDTIDTHKMKMGEFISKNRDSNSVLDRVKSRLGGLGDAFKALGSRIMDVATIAIGNVLANAISNAISKFKNFVSTIINSAGQTEQQAIAFEVLTGSMEGGAKIMKEINALAVRTPYDVSDLRDLTKQMLAFGFSQETVIEDIEMLGDLSAGTGGDLKLLGRAYGQVKTKGKLFAQELNQLGEQGLAVREILAKDLGITVEELMIGMEKKKIHVPFEKLQEVLGKLHKDKFLGLMEKQSDTMAGRFQNLKEQANLMGQEILGIDTATGKIKAGSIIDGITKSLKNSINFLTKNREAILAFAKSATDKLMMLKGAVAEVFDVLFKGDFTGQGIWHEDSPFITALLTIRKTILKLKDPFLTFIKNIDKSALAIGILAGVLIAVLIPTISAIGASLWTALAPILPFVAAFFLIVGAVYLLIQAYKKWTPFQEQVDKAVNYAVTQLWPKLQKTLQDVGTFLSSVFLPAWQYLVSAFNDLKASLEPYLPLIFNIAKVIGVVLVGAIVFTIAMSISLLLALLWVVGGLIKVTSWILTFFTSAYNGIKEFVTNLWTSVGNFFLSVVEKVTTVASDINAKLTEFFNIAKTFIMTIWAEITNFMSMSWQEKLNFIAYWAGYILGFILLNVGNFINGVIAWFQQLPGRISAFFQMIQDRAMQIWANIVQASVNLVLTIIAWFQQLPARANVFLDQIKNKFNEIKGSMIRQAIDLVNSVVGKFNELKNKVTTAFDTIKNIDLKSTGANIIQGLINGIAGKFGELKNIVSEMANSVKEGFTEALKINSPSKLFTEYGVNIAQGPIIGMESKLGELEGMSNEMTQAIISGATNNTTNTNNNTVNQANTFNMQQGDNQGVVKQVLNALARQNQLASLGINLKT